MIRLKHSPIDRFRCWRTSKKKKGRKVKWRT